MQTGGLGLQSHRTIRRPESVGEMMRRRGRVKFKSIDYAGTFLARGIVFSKKILIEEVHFKSTMNDSFAFGNGGGKKKNTSEDMVWRHLIRLEPNRVGSNTLG